MTIGRDDTGVMDMGVVDMGVTDMGVVDKSTVASCPSLPQKAECARAK